MSATSEHCRAAIDAAATNASQQIVKRGRQNVIRSALSVSLLLILIGPALSVLAQMIRWRSGLTAGQWFSWPVLGVASLAVPIAWLLYKVVHSPNRVSRLTALGAMDIALGSSERMVTADQFLKSGDPDAFMQAAIEDSADWAARGRVTRLSTPARPIRLGGSLAAIPAAVLIMILAAWLARLALPTDGDRTLPTDGEFSTVIATVSASRDDPAPPEQAAQAVVAPRTQRVIKPARGPIQKGVVASLTPDGVEESQGKLTDGETSESQQASNPSSARGQPSSQAQSSKSSEPVPRKSKKPKHRAAQPDRPQRPRDEQQDPSGATAGQGSSGGSHNNAAASDWSSRSQQATPDDEELDDEDDVDDEDEEQQSRGGVQPNMRDRRTPVNRDLMIGFGNGRPNPDANGRGGPSGQKKSRGVASLVLGVPIPDRVNGQPNKGRIRITQQRVTPEAEDSDRVLAEQRRQRTGHVGPVHHPQLTPWLQNFIRRYFLTRRKSADPQSGVPISSPTTQRSHSAKGTIPPS